MKKILVTGIIVGACCALAWQCPPLRRRVEDAADTFSQAYRDREAALRAALVPETVHPTVR